jgi:NAD(P)-dependent dehydrogenase (short-subunit alcohol dehydrogenase family)
MANTETQPLAGRTAIVTGASRGIGRGIAQRLGSAGAHVILGARSLETPKGRFAGTVQETAEEIRRAGGRATPLAVDTADPASREAFVKAAIEASGGIDILVNNAGTAIYKEVADFSYAEGHAQIETYFSGPWHLCNLLIPHMTQRGAGWILNLGSSSVIKLPQQPFERHMAYFGHDVIYASLKAAVHRFTQGLAAELYASNIAVNLVAPVGAVWTPGLEGLDLGFSPDHPAAEVVEHISEAALDLVSHPPQEKTGVIAWSYKYLDEIGRPTMSLDGRTVVQERST